MIIIVRGGGDLASGVILRLHRAGLKVAVTELAKPLVVRRAVSFAQAVYDGRVQVEEATGILVKTASDAQSEWDGGNIPVFIDPEGAICDQLHPDVIVDARMRKIIPDDLKLSDAPLVIGLGPGFRASIDCHAVIETIRGPYLGRVIWQGQAIPDTGIPETVGQHQADRVLRAPADGVLKGMAHLGDHLQAGAVIAEVNNIPVLAPFEGILRGLVETGLPVKKGMKIGDVDPRLDKDTWRLVSDKALAVAGGVMEAILSRADLRAHLWD
ncbi:MAG: selenium-dependent molybdenum cofactor biosynthesis protein YqeB [Anaerolineaceae bacterium]